jgi:hypothetical protein
MADEPKAGLITQIHTRYILNTRLGGMGRVRALLVAIKQVWRGRPLLDL